MTFTEAVFQESVTEDLATVLQKLAGLDPTAANKAAVRFVAWEEQQKPDRPPMHKLLDTLNSNPVLQQLEDENNLHAYLVRIYHADAAKDVKAKGFPGMVAYGDTGHTAQGQIRMDDPE